MKFKIKRLAVLLLALSALTSFGWRCSGPKTTDRDRQEMDSDKTDEISDEPTAKENDSDSVTEPSTTIKINTKTVILPALSDFKLNFNGRKVKSISILGVTTWQGLGSMQPDEFAEARTYEAAKEYSDLIAKYDFDRDGRVTSVQSLNSYSFKYDDQGRLTTIFDEDEEGYRGSSSYKIRYDLKWEGDKAVSMTHKILEFENTDMTLEECLGDILRTDFTYDGYVDDMMQVIRKGTITSDNAGNIRVYGHEPDEGCSISDSDGNVTYWIKVEYYD